MCKAEDLVGWLKFDEEENAGAGTIPDSAGGVPLLFCSEMLR